MRRTSKRAGGLSLRTGVSSLAPPQRLCFIAAGASSGMHRAARVVILEEEGFIFGGAGDDGSFPLSASSLIRVN